MSTLKKIDRGFLGSVLALAILGIFIFTSASLGILARNEAKFLSIATNQFFLGFLMGFVALYITSRIPYKFWKKYSLTIFIFTLLLTSLVFVPHIGVGFQGSRRWVDLGFINFQPSELLKIGYVIYLAALFSKFKEKINTFSFGLLPFLLTTLPVAIIILLEPDTDTFFMMFLTGMAMYFVAGATWRHIGVLALIGIIGISAIVMARPYVLGRIMTFIDPSRDTLGASYQIRQSLTAIGSGGFMGKGFGQSTQKFGSLPEPIGDSIFAVASEEFGFIGSTSIIVLFLFFTIKGLRIALRSEDIFARLLCVGIIMLIISGSFINIAAMLGIIPLSGTPLLFISHGGTALFLVLAQTGIILSISRKGSR